MNQHSPAKRYQRNYTLFGICFGLVFPLMAWSLDGLLFQNLPFNASLVVDLHRLNPIHYIIDSAPLFLGLAFGIAGKFISQVYKQKQDLEHLAQEVGARNHELLASEEELRQNLEELQTIQEKLQQQNQFIVRQQQNIVASINYAQRIQQVILPTEEELYHALGEHFVLFQPKGQVSGDFYYCRQEEQKVVLATIDCTGHGVPGAFMSLIANDLLNEIFSTEIEISAGEVLEKLHIKIRSLLRQEVSTNRDGMDMSLIIWNKSEKTMQFAGAKNALLYIENGKSHFIKGNKYPIGGIQKEAQRSFTTHQIALDPPLTIYLFTDGFQDQFGGFNGRKFMLSNLKDLLVNIYQTPFEQQKSVLIDTVNQYMQQNNEKQTDDLLIIGFKTH